MYASAFHCIMSMLKVYPSVFVYCVPYSSYITSNAHDYIFLMLWTAAMLFSILICFSFLS